MDGSGSISMRCADHSSCLGNNSSSKPSKFPLLGPPQEAWLPAHTLAERGGHLYLNKQQFHFSHFLWFCGEDWMGQPLLRSLGSMSESARVRYRIKSKDAFFAGLEELVSENRWSGTTQVFGSPLLCWIFGVLLCCCFHAPTMMRHSGGPRSSLLFYPRRTAC